MKRNHSVCAWILAATVAIVPSAHASDDSAKKMMERLNALAGDWEGTFAWSGGRTASGDLKARYYATGLGSAVVEDLIMNDVPAMTSVYHLDRNDLRMTHYCAARNQPRLKATRIDPENGSADFTIVDATNIGAANPGHVGAFELRVLDEDRIHLKFVFVGGKAQAVEDIDLHRIKKS